MKEYFEKANCKINLAIDVLGKAPNGYHYVDMIMTTLGICDDIRAIIYKGSEIKIKSDSSLMPVDNSNICYKTCQILKKFFNIEFGMEIFIKKRNPIQAGLGGGSADAAAIIRIITDYFNIKDDIPDDVFLKIGADVKFAMTNQTAMAKNFGEKIIRLNNLPKYKVLLIKPNFGISTEKIYNEIDSNIIIKRPNIDLFIKGNKTLVSTYEHCYNVLEHVASHLYPEIEVIKRFIKVNSKPLLCQMSGSGPTIFAIYNDDIMARNIYNMCLNEFTNYGVLLTYIENSEVI